MVRHYDIVAFGTGSSLNIISQLFGMGRKLKVAVVENNMVGGICLTRGCIPSKMLLYPATVARRIRESKKLGIDAELRGLDFSGIMERTYLHILDESRAIEESLKKHPLVDLYQTDGVFVGDYTIDVGGVEIEGDKILLGTGSKPYIPPIPGLDELEYFTNENFFRDLRKLPKRFAIVGGGYVALELGFFLAMMGSEVTVLEMLPRILYGEEPEASLLLQKKLSSFMEIRVDHKVVEARKRDGSKVLVAENLKTGETVEVEADEVLVATGRSSYSDVTRPDKTGVKVDSRGWIVTDDYLRTSKEDVWAFGDANGKHMFKHKANYEAQMVLYNAFMGEQVKASYHAVPHAIFTEPEVASVGMREEEAAKKHKILVGYALYEETARGEAMMVKDYFAKVIVDRETSRLLGAHIVGPEASILIQELVNLMYTRDRSIAPIFRGMHIHPALSEVVEKAFYNLKEPEAWRR